MKLEKIRAAWINQARVFAILLVSLNHAVNRSYSVYGAQSKEYYSIPYGSTVFKMTALVVSHLGVPLFLMISGVLIMKKSFQNEREIRDFYNNNLFSIFLTTEIWYLIIYWGIVLFLIKMNPRI